MKQRIITALILLVIFVIIVAVNQFVVNVVVFAIILAIATYESLKLYNIKKYYLIIVSLIFFFVIPFFTVEEPYSVAIKSAIVAIMVVSGYLTFIKSDNLRAVLPIIYPTAPLFFMFSTYNDLGMEYLVWLVIIVAFCDIGAYFIGKAFGRTPFSKSSPNKTLEGVLGGLVLSVIVSFFYGKFYLSLSPSYVVSTTILVAIFGIFGDLFESYLKRKANVKDSGNILPGHGGILDRIDGYLFGAIGMFLVYSW